MSPYALEFLFTRQLEFQEEVKFPICSNDPETKNRVSETYLMKAVGEIFEVSREFPSGLIPYSKHQPTRNKKKITRETADVFLYLFNFCINEDISPDELLYEIEAVQSNNFVVLYKRKAQERAKKLNENISKSANSNSDIS